jgi:hypothetical protein
MTIARAHLVDPAVTRWYHCITRCVRRAFLLGEGENDRKLWIDNRLEELAGIFSIAVGGFSVLDNHLHVLVRLDPEVAAAWSDEEVVRRWGRLFPPRDKKRQPLPVSHDWVQWRLKDAGWVATARQRLQSLSWFMKCLKEPLARLANLQDKTRGFFFEGRFKSVAILDEESLLATCAEGKAMVSREVAEIFERIGTTAETWQARLEKLSDGRLLGRFLAASRQRLREVAQRLGLRRAVNLGGCLVT